MWGFTVCVGQDIRCKTCKFIYVTILGGAARGTHRTVQTHTFPTSSTYDMHTRPSAPRTDRIHSCLSRAKSRMVAPHDILSSRSFPLLTAPGSCHPDANLPVFITCWKERRVKGWASWRVTGLINPAWQLPDALPGSSPPSLSRACILEGPPQAWFTSWAIKSTLQQLFFYSYVTTS